jgi:hypothetical protein
MQLDAKEDLHKVGGLEFLNLDRKHAGVHISREKSSGLLRGIFFFCELHKDNFFCELYKYRYRRSTCTHTHPTNTRTQSLPLLAPPKRPCRHISRLMKSPQAPRYRWKHNTVRSWNKSRKMQAPVPSRGLELEWAGSTTRNLTNRARLSSLLPR